jgi:hypothetical protein
VVTAYGAATGARGIFGAAMTRTPFDELAHRVNNLLGTITIQAELARGDGSLAAYEEALTRIVESATRTQQELQRLRAPRPQG